MVLIFSTLRKHLFDGNSNIFSDLTKQGGRDIPRRVEWHGGASAVRVAKLFMRSALTNFQET